MMLVTKDILTLKTHRRSNGNRPAASGFTLAELLIALALIGVLVTLGLLASEEYREHAKNTHAIGDIKAIEADIDIFELNYGRLPADLNEIGRGNMVDPWENAYVYYIFQGKNDPNVRRDKFLKPLNTTYDLYSIGEDGKTKGPLTARDSWDDIVRASDGGFIGLGKDY